MLVKGIVDKIAALVSLSILCYHSITQQRLSNRKSKRAKKKKKNVGFYRAKNNFDLSKLLKIVNYFLKKDLVSKIFLL